MKTTTTLAGVYGEIKVFSQADTANDYDTLLKDLAKSETKNNKTELYKFHQERTEKIRTRLWTTLHGWSAFKAPS